MARAERALELDPLSPIINVTQAVRQLDRGRIDLAMEKAEQARDLHPEFYVARLALGRCHQYEGRYQEAVAEFRAIGDIPNVALGLALAGRQQQARDLLNEISQGSHGYVGPGPLGLVHWVLGDRDRGIELIEKAVDDHSTFALSLRGGFASPIDTSAPFAELRSDPRFLALVERVGFPPR